MVNDFGEGMVVFVAMPENKANSTDKKLNITNINTKGALTNRKSGLPLNNLFL